MNGFGLELRRAATVSADANVQCGICQRKERKNVAATKLYNGIGSTCQVQYLVSQWSSWLSDKELLELLR